VQERVLLRILVENLACRRAGRLIFEGLSFGLGPGEALVVTGRNGAGKSTLLAAIAGAVRPTAGRIAIEGAGPDDAPLRERLHVVGHRDGLKTALSARENLAFYQALFGASTLTPEAALARMGLGHAAAIPVAYLSAGQRRRVALARLLVSHRPLWLLDEPTSALDTRAQAGLLGLMQEHLAAGGLIIAATHAPLGLAAREIRIGLDGAPAARLAP
jgi:heme exporter protein A